MRISFKKIKREFWTGTATVIAGFFLLLVSPAKSAFAEPLRLGVVPTLHCTLIYLADSQGFFKKRGVEVAMKTYDAGPAAVDNLAAGHADIATAAETVFVLQAFRHPDIRILATICAGSDVELVVRKDRGIARPQDLEGKKVAVTQGSSGELFLYNYLLFNRIPAGSVRLINMTPAEMVKAMADGTIDAGLSWPPFTTAMEEKLGGKVARWAAQSGQDYYFTLLAKDGFLKKQQKAVEQFLAALLEAEQFAAKYPDRARTILQQRLGLTAAPVLDTWSRARFQLQLSQDMLILMEREAKWAIRNNLVQKKEVPNYLDLIYFDALEKLKPEAVNIVH